MGPNPNIPSPGTSLTASAPKEADLSKRGALPSSPTFSKGDVTLGEYAEMKELRSSSAPPANFKSSDYALDVLKEQLLTSTAEEEPIRSHGPAPGSDSRKTSSTANPERLDGTSKRSEIAGSSQHHLDKNDKKACSADPKPSVQRLPSHTEGSRSQREDHGEGGDRVTIIRPNPVKTKPPAVPHPLRSSLLPPKKEKAWCDQATENRKKEEARRHEYQCTFPEDLEMPSASRQPEDTDHGAAAPPTRNHRSNPHVGPLHEDARMTLPSAFPPTSMHERIVTDEVLESKSYQRTIGNQHRRLVELETVHKDLERRLELEANERRQLETSFEARERVWKEKLIQIETQRNELIRLKNVEEAKNAWLAEQMARKDKDIQQMIQRKVSLLQWTSSKLERVRSHTPFPQYDPDGGFSRPARSVRPASTLERVTSNEESLMSPRLILEKEGSVEDARVRNAQGLLLDFFGL